VESAAAVEIGFGGLRPPLLADFHKLLGKHKMLSTLPTGTAKGLSTSNFEINAQKTHLPDLLVKE